MVGISSERQEFLTHSQFWVLIPSWESQPHPRPAESTKAPQRAKGSRGERATPLVAGRHDGGEDRRDDFYSCEFAQVTSHDFLRLKGAEELQEQRTLGCLALEFASPLLGGGVCIPWTLG